MIIQTILTGSLLTLLCTGCNSTGRLNENEISTAIRGVLTHQVRGWNRGNLEQFMEGYRNSENLRFASGGDVFQGWETTLERYRKKYPDRAAMGQLAFSDLDITVLSPDAALVFGRWKLRRAIGEVSGLFTLLFRKQEENWRIVHDHTSSAQIGNQE